MSQSMLPAGSSTVGLLSLADSLGIDPNALVNATTVMAGTPGAFTWLAEAQKAVDVLTEYNVSAVRRNKASWATIGRYLGVSAQAAHKRFRHLEPSGPARR